MDFKEKYTFSVTREYENGRTVTTEVHSDALCLADLLQDYADFLRGSGFTFVDEVVATKSKGGEVSSANSWDGVNEEDGLLIADLFLPDADPQSLYDIVDEAIKEAEKANDSAEKTVDKNKDFLDNIFNSKKPKLK